MNSKLKNDGSRLMGETSFSFCSKLRKPSATRVLNDLEKAAINEMRKLYMETLKVDVEINNRMYEVEKMLEPRFDIIYDRRLKLLSAYRKKVLGNKSKKADNYNGQVAHFWLNVLKASFDDLITEDDEKILVHLTDIRSKTILEPRLVFVLHFFFEPNEFFSNKELTKTYFLNTSPNPESPLTYDGAEIIGSMGCHIDWKYERNDEENSNENDTQRFASFFDFFNPPKIKTGEENDNSDIKALIQEDFNLGSYLKERVIPQAVFFFTGEIIDCQHSETDSEEEFDEVDAAENHKKGDENNTKADEETKNHNANDNQNSSASKSNDDDNHTQAK